MDWLTFISKLIEAVAWPVAVLVIVKTFKKQLLALAPALKKLSFPGGLEAEFESKLEKLEVDPELDANAGTSPVVQPTLPVDTTALRANPTGVVMEKWKEIEAAARTLISRSPGANRLYVISLNSHQLGKELLRRELITSEQAGWFSELRALRNMAAHSQLSISPDQVERYVELANRLLGSLADKLFATDPAATTSQPAAR